MDKVDIIVSGYEWVCPECGTFNREIERTETVICGNPQCTTEFEADYSEHTLG